MFAVVEGTDASGKSSIIKEAIRMTGNQWVYSQAFTHNSGWDSYIHSHPSSFLFYLGIAAKTSRTINPNLRWGKTVVQDRYVQSVDSYLPDSEWVHNKIIRKLASPLFLKPDLYVQCLVSLEECLERLAKDNETGHDEYHDSLISNPERLVRRERKYMKIFERMNCPKHILDTTGKTVQDSATELVELIRRYERC